MIKEHNISLKTYTDQLDEKWINQLVEKDLFKMFIPASLGGLEANLADASKLLVDTATFHGSLGWIHNLGAGANYFCGFFDEETAQHLFSPKNAISSGSGRSSGQFELVNEGFKLNGEWDKCTGANYASLFTANAIDKNENIKSFIIPKEEVEIIKSWMGFGLKTSSSDSFKLSNVVIPKTHTFEIGIVKSFDHYFIYKVPFELFARICLSASFEGIVRCFINHFNKLNQSKKLKDDIQTAIEQLNKLFTFREQLAVEIEKAIKSNNPITESTILKASNSLGDRHFNIYKTIAGIYWNGGLSLSNEKEFSHWAFRDVMTAIQHYMIKVKS